MEKPAPCHFTVALHQKTFAQLSQHWRHNSLILKLVSSSLFDNLSKLRTQKSVGQERSTLTSQVFRLKWVGQPDWDVTGTQNFKNFQYRHGLTTLLREKESHNWHQILQTTWKSATKLRSSRQELGLSVVSFHSEGKAA